MAGLKKPAKKPNNSGSPNTVLVVFLVLFVLLSIGLGVGLYYGYAGQDALKKLAADAEVKAKASDKAEKYFGFISRELRLASGEKLDEDDLTRWSSMRTEVMKDDSPYKAEKSYEAVRKLIDGMKAEIGFDNEKYTVSYKERIAKLAEEVKGAKAEASAAVGARKLSDEKFQKLNASYDAFYKTVLAKIKEGNDEAIKLANVRNNEIKEAKLINDKLQGEIDNLKSKFDEDVAIIDLKYNKLAQAYDALTKERKDAPNANPRGAGVEPHALLLDVSRGKPLWDRPLGKITRVETQDRQVVINLGSADRVKPELTFNVFAPWKGQADKELKATIEVIRVLDENSSIARVTSLYDGSGREIDITSEGRGRLQREAENPLKEGDLLFNVFWQQHIAIAGRVSFSDLSNESRAEQARNLSQFMQLLQRQGVIVDAYIDLTDGSVKGAMTAKTRFLVRGQAVRGDEDMPAEKKDEKEPAEKDKGDKVDKGDKADKGDGKDEKMPEKGDNGGAGADRAQKINEAIKSMRTEAIERGMFLISAQNYANVCGYRPPRSANSAYLDGFRPSLPNASTLGSLLFQGGGNAPNPAPMDKEK